MNLFIKSATIIDSQSDFNSKTLDIVVENGIITKIGQNLKNTKSYKEVSLPDLHISPGWFDPSVNFGEPGYEERETIENGLKCAALSGFTTVGLNTNSSPAPESGSDLSYIHQKSAKTATSLLAYGALTQKSEGLHLAELFDMHQEGAIAFSDYKKPIDNANLLKIALQYAKGFNGLVCSTPLDNSVAKKGVVNEGKTSTQLGLKGIPKLAEELRVSRDIHLAEYTKGKLHIPCISTEASVAMIREAKSNGVDISCSVAVHNIVLDDRKLRSFDTKYKVNPPLRLPKDCEALKDGLKDGTIDMITSDHNPMDIEHKKKEFEHASYGTIGLESAYPALNTIFTTKQIVKFLTRGRKRFGLDTSKIAEGEKLEVTLFSPNGKYQFEESNISSKSRNSIFIGEEVKGKVYGIYANKKLKLNS